MISSSSSSLPFRRSNLTSTSRSTLNAYFSSRKILTRSSLFFWAEIFVIYGINNSLLLFSSFTIRLMIMKGRNHDEDCDCRGTGFIGRHLTNALTARGHHVYILTRKPAETEQKHFFRSLAKNGARPEKDLTDIDVWINLAGKSLFGRWNEKRRRRSRQAASALWRSRPASYKVFRRSRTPSFRRAQSEFTEPVLNRHSRRNLQFRLRIFKQNDSFVGTGSRTNRSAWHPHRLDAFWPCA